MANSRRNGSAPDAGTTPAPDAGTPDAPVTDAPVTDAPVTDAPEQAPEQVGPSTGDATLDATLAALERAVTDAPELTPAQARKQRAQADATTAVERYTPDDDCEWVAVKSGGQVAVCNSAPNAQGKSYLYVVHRWKGRDTAIPLLAIDTLTDAGQI